MAARICRRLGAIRNVDLGEDVADVSADSVPADDKCVGYLGIRSARRNQTQHLHLALGEPVWVFRPAASAPRQPGLEVLKPGLKRNHW